MNEEKALSDDQIAQFKIRRPQAFQYFNDENGEVNQLATAENDWSGCHPRNGFRNYIGGVISEKLVTSEMYP